ncbi:MAG: response regulator, partial [bacterium]
MVSDIEMPKMNGYELCHAIKNSQELQHTPVILLSTLSDAEDIIRGLAAGADNYITKPYDINFLIAKIEDLRLTPIQADASDSTNTIPVTLGGQVYEVRAGRQQTLNLLVSV